MLGIICMGMDRSKSLFSFLPKKNGLDSNKKLEFSFSTIIPRAEGENNELKIYVCVFL